MVTPDKIASIKEDIVRAAKSKSSYDMIDYLERKAQVTWVLESQELQDYIKHAMAQAEILKAKKLKTKESWSHRTAKERSLPPKPHRGNRLGADWRAYCLARGLNPNSGAPK